MRSPIRRNAEARRVKVSMSLFNQKGAKAFEVGPLDETQLAGHAPGSRAGEDSRFR